MDWEDVKSDLWQDGNFCRELENLINAAMECVSEPSAVLQECFAQFTVLKQK